MRCRTQRRHRGLLNRSHDSGERLGGLTMKQDLVRMRKAAEYCVYRWDELLLNTGKLEEIWVAMVGASFKLTEAELIGYVTMVEDIQAEQ